MADIIVAGNTSGAITISAPLVAGSGVLTLPVIAADTLAGIAATQTLTNKTLVAPALGTPASGVLTNCTGVPASALPAGSVLQVVQGTYATTVSSSTTTFIDTGLTATITPRSTSSKILVLINHNQNGKSNGDGSNGISFRLFRGVTSIQNLTDYLGYTQSATAGYFSFSSSYLDSPATTSATTYKTQFASSNNTASVSVQNQAANSPSFITLMEIQG